MSIVPTVNFNSFHYTLIVRSYASLNFIANPSLELFPRCSNDMRQTDLMVIGEAKGAGHRDLRQNISLQVLATGTGPLPESPQNSTTANAG